MSDAMNNDDRKNASGGEPAAASDISPSRSVLHVGNILNNGYLHCKYLRKRGIYADALNIDYKHCQGQPEWAEVLITEEIDEWEQDWREIDLGGFKRPDWFFDLSFGDIPAFENYLKRASQGEPIAGIAREWTVKQSVKPDSSLVKIRKLMGRSLAAIGMKEFILRNLLAPVSKSPVVDKISRIAGSKRLLHGPALVAEAERIRDRLLSNRWDAVEPASTKDVLEWLPRSLARQAVFNRYRLLHAYSLDPIYALLSSKSKPYICYEHGTLREFPFENSARGRLYSHALKAAEKVIITNSDCIQSANRLGLENHVFIPHIIDDELFEPSTEYNALRKQLQEETGCEWVLLAPARHHWKNAPAELRDSWFKRNDILIEGVARFVASYPDVRLLVVFFDWGQEVSLTKQLVRKLGLEDRVRWEPIRSKPVLQQFYQAADVVLDQFGAGMPTLGGVAAEAMASGKPIITNFAPELHRWCYSKMPPVLRAANASEVAEQLKKLWMEPGFSEKSGRLGRMWYDEFHSSDIVIDRLVAVYQEIGDKYGWSWP